MATPEPSTPLEDLPEGVAIALINANKDIAVARITRRGALAVAALTALSVIVGGGKIADRLLEDSGAQPDACRAVQIDYEKRIREDPERAKELVAGGLDGKSLLDADPNAAACNIDAQDLERMAD